MNRVSVALTASFAAPLSLLTLDISRPIGFGLSTSVGSDNTFLLWGTLDSAATDGTNAQAIGQFSGLNGGNLPLGLAREAATWPYLLVQRLSGSTAGTFFAVGDPMTVPAIVSTAAPVVEGGYSAVVNLTTLSALGVRLGASRQMTASDVFDVYFSEDNAITSSVGCYYAGRISGGGGTRQISVFTEGLAYAIVRRVAGATAGTILAAGVSPTTSSVVTAAVDYRQHYRFSIDASADQNIVLFNQAAAVQAGTEMNDLYVYQFVYPPGWPSAAVLTMNGTDRAAAVLSEPFPPPPADAGGTVRGTKVFATWTNITNSTPSAGPLNAALQYRNVIAVSSAPVTAFTNVIYNGTPRTVTTFDLVEGWVAVDGAVIAIGNPGLVFYTYTLAIT